MNPTGFTIKVTKDKPITKKTYNTFYIIQLFSGKRSH